jgi:hypothetical protein
MSRRRHTPEQVVRKRDPVTYALDQDLLSITEMRHLFPESELLRERVAGLIKSVIALRR